jgi:hypothetical protein
MRVTSFLKVQLEDYEPVVLSLYEEDFSLALRQYPELGLDDFILMSHLGFIFPVIGSIGSLLPQPVTSRMNLKTVALVGTLFDKYSVPELKSDTATLGCFTDYFLRYFIAHSLAMDYPHLENAIMNSSKEELEVIINDVTDERFYVIDKPVSIKILRCDPEDMDIISNVPVLARSVPIELQNPDAFDIARARLVNENEVLNGKGYSPAEYIAQGDYIQMWSDTALSPNPDFGDPDVSVSCTPTSIEFLPRVVATPEKPKVTLRVSITVDGRNIFFNPDTRGEYTDLSFNLTDWNSEDNTPQGIVDEIFLYSGIDLMRQRNADSWFTYSPYSTDSPNNVPVTIHGRESGMPSSQWEIYRDVDCVMTFMLIDNLQPNQIDFTKEQWGEEVNIYSCSEYISMAT